MSELWAAIIEWIAVQSPGRLDKIDGLWRGETPEWTVEVNGHGVETDGLAPFNIRIVHKVYASVGIISPSGGCIAAASEDDIIKHFNSQL